MSIAPLNKVVKRFIHSTEELVSAHLGSPQLVDDAVLHKKAVTHESIKSARVKEWSRWQYRMSSGAGDAQKAASARAWLSMHIERGDFMDKVSSLLVVAGDQIGVACANPVEPRYVVRAAPCVWSCRLQSTWTALLQPCAAFLANAHISACCTSLLRVAQAMFCQRRERRLHQRHEPQRGTAWSLQPQQLAL